MQNNKLEILLKAKKGIVTTQDLANIGINKYQMQKLVINKKLVRLRKGIYIDDTLKLDRYYIIQGSLTDVVFSYRSALYLLGYLEQNPDIEITSYRELRYRKNNNYIFHRVKKECYDLGLIELESITGHKIKLYNIERTICDIVKNAKWFETIEFEKILIKYFKSKTKDVAKLLEYAHILKVFNYVSFIVEVMNGS